MEVPLIVIDDSESDDDDVVEVVASVPEEQLPTAAAARQIGDDDDVELLGASNVLRLPHARHDCTQHVFVQDVLHKNTSGQAQAADDGLEANKKTCLQCYCFVCDVPASDCKSWSGALTASASHCLATNKGVDAVTWCAIRDEKKGGKGATSSLPRAEMLAARRRAANQASPTAPTRSAATHAPHSQPNQSDAKDCSRCKRGRPKSDFSATQWSRDIGRRCKDCIALQQQQPPAKQCTSCARFHRRSDFSGHQWRRAVGDTRGRQCLRCENKNATGGGVSVQVGPGITVQGGQIPGVSVQMGPGPGMPPPPPPPPPAGPMGWGGPPNPVGQMGPAQMYAPIPPIPPPPPPPPLPPAAPMGWGGHPHPVGQMGPGQMYGHPPRHPPPGGDNGRWDNDRNYGNYGHHYPRNDELMYRYDYPPAPACNQGPRQDWFDDRWHCGDYRYYR